MKVDNELIVEIGYTGNNYTASIPLVPGCVSTGDTLEEIKQNIAEALIFHIEGSMEDHDPLPEIVKINYELVYKISTEALLSAYSDIFTKAALSRVTGINERQLWHYASGLRKPQMKQVKRIEDGLHKLGIELTRVTLINDPK